MGVYDLHENPMICPSVFTLFLACAASGAVPGQTQSGTTLAELVSLPFARGDKIFTSRKAPQGGVDFCVQNGPSGTPRVLIIASEAPLDALEPLTDFSVSSDGQLCAYFTTQSDAKYESIRIVDVKTGKPLEDVISWTHYGDIGWNGDGLYYGGYRKPEPGSTGYSDERVLYHRLGTPQDRDLAVYEDRSHPKRKYFFLATYDHRFLLIHVLEKAAGKTLVSEWFRREGSIQAPFKPLQPEMAPGRFYLCDNVGDHLVLLTMYKSPKGRVVDVDQHHPEESAWKTVLPEPVDDAEPFLGNMVVLQSQPGGGNKATMFSLKGEFLRTIPTDAGATVDVQSCGKREKYGFLSMEKGGVRSYFLYDQSANRLVPFH